MATIDNFKDYMKSKGISDSTIDKYVWALNKYTADYGDIKLCTQESITSFLATSRSTVCRGMLANVIEWKPQWFKNISLARKKAQPRKLPNIMKEYEADVLLAELPKEYVLPVWLMVECGLRVSEAVSLRVEHIDFEDSTIRVLGKGNKERLVYISPGLKNRLETLSARLGWSGYLFPSPINEGKPIHTNTIRKHMKKILPHTRPHQLRHLFATKVYTGTDDLRVVQDLLGHSNIATTSIYARVTNKKAAEAAKIAWKE